MNTITAAPAILSEDHVSRTEVHRFLIREGVVTITFRNGRLQGVDYPAPARFQTPRRFWEVMAALARKLKELTAADQPSGPAVRSLQPSGAAR